MKKHIPNAITLMNLVSGTLGVIFLFSGDLTRASAMIFFAALFDFFDGFLARLLGVHSSIGKSLDSLADMVSFGLLPGLIVYTMQTDLGGRADPVGQVLVFSSLLIPVCSALRLAIFNNDEEQKYIFRGLPTPANALFFAAAGVALGTGQLSVVPENRIWVFFFTVVLSLLLISRLKMFAFKFTDYSVRNNLMKYSFLALSVILILLFKAEGIALSILLYILFSLAGSIFKKGTVI